MQRAPPTPYHTPPNFLNGFRRFTKMTFLTTKSAKFAEKRKICINVEHTSRCFGGVMQSMPSIASCMDLDFKRLQLQCGSQSKPLRSLQ